MDTCVLFEDLESIGKDHESCKETCLVNSAVHDIVVAVHEWAPHLLKLGAVEALIGLSLGVEGGCQRQLEPIACSGGKGGSGKKEENKQKVQKLESELKEVDMSVG